MIEDADDMAVFFDAEAFGEFAGYVLADESDTADIEGIYQDAHAIAAPGDFAGVSTTAPTFTTAQIYLPAGAGKGDMLSRPTGELFTVEDIQPDGTGLVRLILERL